jgi:hypothetical protein
MPQAFRLTPLLLAALRRFAAEQQEVTLGVLRHSRMFLAGIQGISDWTPD